MQNYSFPLIGVVGASLRTLALTPESPPRLLSPPPERMREKENEREQVRMPLELNSSEVQRDWLA